ncbi:MAG TPA: hypothetical protein VFZ23_18555 [Pyrinomonadaceae bacterium]
MLGDDKSYCYRAYGLNINSAVQLPDLIAGDQTPDAQIRYGHVSDSPALEALEANCEVFERPGFRMLVSAGQMCIRWERVGTFLVHRGDEIIVEPEEGILEKDLQAFLTGPVLSVLLHQRGYFVLHASAVVIGGSAVAFLGAKGDGKSTLAAHMQVRGHRLIADDIVPVQLQNGSVVVTSGFPRIKLYDDSIMAVGGEPSDFPLIHSLVEKRSFRHRDNFSTEPIPLSSIFVLAESEDIGLRQLGQAAAFIEVTRHTFVNRYLRALDEESKHFQQCQQLVKTLPVWMLSRPHDFTVIHEVCSLIEDHVRNNPADACLSDDLLQRSGGFELE